MFTAKDKYENTGENRNGIQKRSANLCKNFVQAVIKSS